VVVAKIKKLSCESSAISFDIYMHTKILLRVLIGKAEHERDCVRPIAIFVMAISWYIAGSYSAGVDL